MDLCDDLDDCVAYNIELPVSEASHLAYFSC